MKLVFNIIIAFIGLVVLLPVFMISTILILMIDRMPPFFVQERIGVNRSKFSILKFRTMKSDKITGLGRVLRRTGIDEIPQLINILKGDMSIVGPRPLTESDVLRLGWDLEYYKKRWNVKPGIIGLAQLSPICHKKMSWMFDRSYIENRSFGLDMKILFSSMAVPFVGKDKVKNWIYPKR